VAGPVWPTNRQREDLSQVSKQDEVEVDGPAGHSFTLDRLKLRQGGRAGGRKPKEARSASRPASGAARAWADDVKVGLRPITAARSRFR
jgi:hypothetical protein